MSRAEATPESRGAASETLLRLVRFAAAACDVRYAFVAALDAPDEQGVRHTTFWVARDYGLRTECQPLDLAAASNPVDCVLALCRIWPDEAELPHLAVAASCVTVPLLDDHGRLLGHMGILDPGRSCRYAGDRLPPLGRLAAAQLAIWTRP